MLIAQPDIWTILLGFGTLNGLFFALLLWNHKQGSKVSNRILAIMLVCISIFISELTLTRHGLYLEYPQFILYSFPASYLIAPLFYFYVVSLTRKELSWSPSMLAHLIPLGLALTLLIPFYFSSYEERIAYMELFSRPEELSFRHIWFGGIFFIQTFLYLFLCFRFLREFEQKYKSRASGTWISRLEWLKRLMILFTLFSLLNAVVSLLLILFDIAFMNGVEMALVVLTFFAHMVGYNAIKHPDRLFTRKEESKYAHSTLAEDNRSLLLERLQHHMTEEKPFLDSELTLGTLATELNVHPDHLSQAINAELSINFYDFVNGYRVEEAKERLQDPANQQFSILGIALDSGFNSKSSFNRIFKKNTGLTPSQFLKKRSPNP